MRLFSLNVVEARQELGPLEDEPDGPTAAQEKEDDPRQGVAREVAPPDVVGGAVVGWMSGRGSKQFFHKTYGWSSSNARF